MVEPKVEEKSEKNGVEEKANECVVGEKTNAEVPVGEKDTHAEIPVERKATPVKLPVRKRTIDEMVTDTDIPAEERASVDLATGEGKWIDELRSTILVGYMDLPESIKRRINALKKLQVKIIDKDALFYQNVFKLEIQHDECRKNNLKKRLSIINGEYEPKEEECDYPSPNYENESDEYKQVKIERECYPAYDENDKGIPKFWLTIFKNSSVLYQAIYSDDEPVLAHLQDITVKFHESPFGFTLEFHFSENEYFSNEVLTKYYKLNIEPSETDPFSFEGQEIIDCKGCQIDWKDCKNVTIKTIMKLTYVGRPTILKPFPTPVQIDSFFNFFDPPPINGKISEMSVVNRERIKADFELGNFIKDRIIPRAVLYYTGEEFDDDDDDAYEDCEEVDEE